MARHVSWFSLLDPYLSRVTELDHETDETRTRNARKKMPLRKAAAFE